MHLVADELKFLNQKDLGRLQNNLSMKLGRPDYVPYTNHIDEYVLKKLKS